MVNIQSPTAEIRRGKKRKKKKKNKPQHENIMVCPITQGDHNYLPTKSSRWNTRTYYYVQNRNYICVDTEPRRNKRKRNCW